ncbi:MAG TPA: PadR family transcriptional regulator [Vicinamibacterales bacterium]|nr:PadR family transcriptional regulator [Vicinamibacterales bacterium]
MARTRGMSFGGVAILHALADGKRFGFEIMDATGLTSGTVYPTLDRFEEARLVRSQWEDARIAHREGRPPRRYFTLTPAGAEALSDGLRRFKTFRPVAVGDYGGKAGRR